MDQSFTNLMTRLSVSNSEHQQSFNSNDSKNVQTPSKSSMFRPTTSKTPSAKTPKSAVKGKTPNKGVRTPGGGDRFIVSRSATKMDLANYKVRTHSTSSSEASALLSPNQIHYKQAMSRNLNGDMLDSKVLAFSSKPPPAPEAGHLNSLQVLYSSSKLGSRQKKSARHIPQVPERILDAPDILDDYYLSLVSWSAQNVLAVALASAVYLWDASSGDISLLMELGASTPDYISCVEWTSDGNHLAVGLSNGDIQLWDHKQQKKLRTMSGHSTRVGSMSWNKHILSSGSRTGAIHHSDVRVANHQVGSCISHTQEVCGLQWSPSGAYLASGGNDNLLNIWQHDPGSRATNNSAIHTFSEHRAAVKALAWCPWQNHILASGGGTADRHIRFWNCNSGTNLSSVDTHSQVCALIWSPEYREIISGHGFSQNQLTIWKYPTMTKVADLTGHTARILHMCVSPDGSTVLSAGADETLRLWKCFDVDEETKKAKAQSCRKMEDWSSLKHSLR